MLPFHLCRLLLAVLVAAFALPGIAHAQPLAAVGNVPAVDRDKPVTFIADQVEYDREAGIVTASGHVEAWQGDHVLRADKIIYDRNTGVAAAKGNVVRAERDAVRRLRRTYRGHARWCVDCHAHAADRKWPPCGQWRASHRGSDQRAQPCGLHHLQPVRGRPDQAAALANTRAFGGAGHREQEDRVLRRGDGDVRRADRVFPIFLAPGSLGEARFGPAASVVRFIQASRRVLRSALLLGGR